MLLPRDAPSFQPPAGITPNFVNPDSLRPATIGVGVVVEVLAFVFVVLRLLANSSDGRKLWWNDVACIVAFIFSVGCTAIIIRVSPMARHQYDIPESWYDASYFKSVYVLTVFLNLGMFAAKNTMLLLYLRIFNVNKTLRRAIIGGIIFTIPVYWISVVLESYYCAPHVGSGRWDLVLAVYCSHASLYSIIQGVLNVLLDLKKLGVLSIFATALIGLIASIISMVFRAKFYRTHKDIGWETAGLFICLLCEINVIIICSCMPALASLSQSRLVKSIRSLQSLLHTSNKHTSSSHVENKPGRRTWVGSRTTIRPQPYISSHPDMGSHSYLRSDDYFEFTEPRNHIEANGGDKQGTARSGITRMVDVEQSSTAAFSAS